MFIPARKLLDAAVTLLNADTFAANGKLAGSFLGLLTAPLGLTINTVYGDVSASLATALGYPLIPLTFTGPIVAQGGFSLMSGGGHIVEMSGSDTGTTIYGQVILGSDSVTYLAGELFDAPRPLGALEAGFVTNPLFGLGPNASGYGNSIVSL